MDMYDHYRTQALDRLLMNQGTKRRYTMNDEIKDVMCGNPLVAAYRDLLVEKEQEKIAEQKRLQERFNRIEAEHMERFRTHFGDYEPFISALGVAVRIVWNDGECVIRLSRETGECLGDADDQETFAVERAIDIAIDENGKWRPHGQNAFDAWSPDRLTQDIVERLRPDLAKAVAQSVKEQFSETAEA